MLRLVWVKSRHIEKIKAAILVDQVFVLNYVYEMLIWTQSVLENVQELTTSITFFSLSDFVANIVLDKIYINKCDFDRLD